MGPATAGRTARIALPQRTQGTTRNTKECQGEIRRDFIKGYNVKIERLWGAAPRPGREKFSLHPRHVCDVPKDAVVPRRTERATDKAPKKTKPPSF